MISVRNKSVPHGRDELMQIAVAHEYLPLAEHNWAERWCTLPKVNSACYDEILNFKLKNDDVFLLGFTKSGTLWLQEAVWLLINQLDFERANSIHPMERTLVLELLAMQSPAKVESLKILKNMPSPRFIKSHLSANLLPKEIWEKKHKIIYIARNVKDVITSCFHFYKNLGFWTDNIDNCVQAFVADEINFTPYWSHVIEFWKLRNESHVFFVTYEEMKQDLASVIQRLCIFLDRTQLTEKEMIKTLEHLSFDVMKENQQSNITGYMKHYFSKEIQKDFQFIRRGIVGSYKDELSEENQKILTDWTQKSLAKYGLKEEDILGKVFKVP